MRIILSVLILTLSTCLQAAADMLSKFPSPYKAIYAASYNGIPIKTVNTLTATDYGYLLHSKAENFLGYIEEKETINVSAKGDISPTNYEYRRSLIGNKRSETTVFDATASTAQNTYKKNTVTFGLDESLLAPLSYQLKLRQDLMAGKKTFHYRVIYRNKIRDYEFVILGQEMVSTAFGNIEATKIQRVRETEERETFLWLAESMDYLPVRLLQKEDGETYELQLANYEPTHHHNK